MSVFRSLYAKLLRFYGSSQDVTGLSTAIGRPGSDALLATEQAVREGITEPFAHIDRCGFVDRTQTSLSFNDSTYTLTLSDAGSGWQYYRAGVLCSISGNKTVTLAGSPPSTNVYFVFIDAEDGTLTASTTAWSLQDSKIPVCLVLWNNSNTPKYWVADERHSCLMDRRTHLYLHNTRSTQLVSGATLAGYTVSHSSPVDTHNTISIAAATIADEDLYLSLAQVTDPDGATNVYSVWYKSGGTWVWESAPVPFRYTTNGYIQYDNAGTMTEGKASRWYNWYLICTNLTGDARFAFVAGKSEFASTSAAYAEDPSAFDWSGLPIAECVIVWQLTFDTSNSFTTKGKCRLTRFPQRVNVSVTTAVASTILASAVQVDTTNFNGVLSSADITTQAALETLDNTVTIVSPTGAILLYGGSFAPNGWLLCDGKTISPIIHANLSVIIGLTYGYSSTLLGNCSFSIASPSIAYTGDWLSIGDAFIVTTTGMLPTGMKTNTIYFVLPLNYTYNGFSFALSPNGTPISTAGTQSGIHTMHRLNTVTLPDLCGRVGIGAGQGSGLTNRTLGAVGGEEAHALTEAENAAHTHTINVRYDGTIGATYTRPTAATANGTLPTDSSGSGTAHNTMPPYLVLNYIIKT